MKLCLLGDVSVADPNDGSFPDFRALKRLKSEMAELFSESIRSFVTRSLASSLSTSSSSENSDIVLSHRKNRLYNADVPILSHHQSGLYASYQSFTDGTSLVEELIRRPSSILFPTSGVGAEANLLCYGSLPHGAKCQSLDSSRNCSVPSPHVAATNDSQNFPTLLGAQALTLEPTVSIQQIDVNSHWLEHQSMFSEDTWALSSQFLLFY